MFDDIYKNRRVLVTGHTGFKGSWLTFWLEKLGANVCGAALEMKTEYVHYDLLKMKNIRSETLDVRDGTALTELFADFKPEIVFHLAAQPLVRLSYAEPAATFAANVMGTVNVLEAARLTPGVRAIVAVTSDKCYENSETGRPFVEGDPMGGRDPYSASKGCAELVAASWRESFFKNETYGEKHNTLLATARAGNVVGGGDWADDRLAPDLMKAAAAGRVCVIRNPDSVRPWQHVLEPLAGYLALVEKLYRGKTEFASAWNFGPDREDLRTVRELAESFARQWDAVKLTLDPPAAAPDEAKLLLLDSSKAVSRLGWRPLWSGNALFARTIDWYRDFYEKGEIDTERDLSDYVSLARKKGLDWTK